jgi:predicted GNAT superfamily acetyltransferase
MLWFLVRFSWFVLYEVGVTENMLCVWALEIVRVAFIVMSMLRPFHPDDLAELVAYNNAEVPHVSELTFKTGAALVAMAEDVTVAVDGEAMLGFVVAFTPGSEYHSLNYRWFADNLDDFVYVDRIVVLPETQSRGIGRALYAHVGALASQRNGVVACEVNLEPPNGSSMRFHERIGFSEIGQLGGAGKRVAMLVWNVGT